MTAELALPRTICAQAGFDPQVVTDAHLHAALRRRQQARSAATAAAYASNLANDPVEQQEFLEELLVRESWFFRDQGPFELLAELAASRWQRHDAPVRALSAPCAGGEEPYSIAMALAGGGLPLARINVEALDLSRRGLAAAAAAVYPERALGKLPAALRERWLQPVEVGRWQVDEALQHTVRLHHGNLLAVPGPIAASGFDIIFCRNALIYLLPDARAKVLDELTGLLAPGGVLIVGHAETALLRGRPFKPLGRSGSFAFERSVAATNTARPAPAPAPSSNALRATRRASTTAAPSSGSAPRCNPEARLEQARRQADRGAYADAAAEVSALLDQQPDNAEAQHLLGLIRSAEGNTTAARLCFQRALYLAPTHLPSLQHLALLAERCGDAAQARLLQQRVARLESGA